MKRLTKRRTRGKNRAVESTLRGRWTQKFPWCRGTNAYGKLAYPRGTGIEGEGGYPSLVNEFPLLVEETRFLRFMGEFWSLEVSPADLNILEYYGLVIPPRKAKVESLRRVDFGVPNELGVWRTSQLWNWSHRLRWHVCSRFQCAPPRSLWYKHMGHFQDFNDLNIKLLRPLPMLVAARYDLYRQPPIVQEPTPDELERMGRRRRPIDVPEWSRSFTAVELRNLGLWCRPADVSFWGSLALTKPVPSGGGDPDLKSSPSWIRDLIGPASQNPLRLDPESAAQGNFGVTRFYCIGARDLGWFDNRQIPAERYCQLGQDWWVAQLVGLLRDRANLRVALEVERAMQAPRVNAPRQLFERVRGLWREQSKSAGRPMPALIASLHRDVLLTLLHGSRPAAVTQAESFRALGDLAALAPNAVRAAIHKGRTILVSS